MKDSILAFISDNKLKEAISVKDAATLREELRKKLFKRSKPFMCFYDFEQWVVGESIKFKPKR